MIHTRCFTFNDFQENTYVLYDDTKECIVIDPGCYYPEEKKELADFIEGNSLKPVMLINTHCHIDHVLGNTFVSERYDLPLCLHEKELQTYSETVSWAVMLNVKVDPAPGRKVFITEKDVIRFGESELRTAFTPGHSIASLTFYNPEQKLAIVGDVLFRESIGRTDLPGGDHATLLASIRKELFVWPDDMKVYPGHGQPTTIGHEKKYNPFLTGQA